jgi:pimeloyl-ACP methyl ester carboxylesterase
MHSLVLLPGLLCDETLWHAQSEALSSTTNLTIPTLDQHDTITALAAQVLAATPPRFALAALSMGGYVALEIMRQAPERVTRLALFDTSARPDSPEQKDRRQALITLSKMGKFKGVTPRLLPMLIHHSRLNDKAVTAPILAMGERIGQEGFQRQQTAILSRIDSRPFLPTIRCPTIIVVGAQDEITPPGIAQEMANLIPSAQLTIIPDCGHLPPLETPAMTTELLQKWLNG